MYAYPPSCTEELGILAKYALHHEGTLDQAIQAGWVCAGYAKSQLPTKKTLDKTGLMSLEQAKTKLAALTDPNGTEHFTFPNIDWGMVLRVIEVVVQALEASGVV